MTYNLFRSIALGVLGLQVVEFREMRLGDFFLKLHGYRKNQEQHQEFTASLVRMQTMIWVNTQIPDKKGRFKDPEKFWPFPWDKKTGKAAPKKTKTTDELRAQSTAMLNILKQMGK